jgi:hypothetical protein
MSNKIAAHVAEGKQYFPLAAGSQDGWHKDGRATATCYCGAIQLSFVRSQITATVLVFANVPFKPVEGPGFVGTFVCHCPDCHKFTASMFASNFTVLDEHLVHERGQDNFTIYKQNKTIVSGMNMSNYFCKTCGSLMYRIAEDYPGVSLLRIGTVDDFTLMETKLRPQLEQFTENRVSWVHEIDGARKAGRMGFEGESAKAKEAKV